MLKNKRSMFGFQVITRNRNFLNTTSAHILFIFIKTTNTSMYLLDEQLLMSFLIKNTIFFNSILKK